MNAATDLHLIHGGHKGTESVFGEMAEKHGISETTISFEGHSMERAVNVEVLDDEVLEKGHVSMDFVFQAMGRQFASGKGLRRVIYSMFHVVTRSDELFAIGWIQENGTVRGGTGWGVELCKLFNRKVHVYDQDKNAWFTWERNEWKRTEPRLPRSGAFSATGTRRVTDQGRAAVEKLFADSLEG